MSQIQRDQVTTFIERLHALTAADRARLKRNAGNTPAESRGVTALFFRLLPHGVGNYHEPYYFLVATLFPLTEGDRSGHNLGQALYQAKARSERNEKGFDRRFEVLLDADADQIGFRLRQIVQLLASAKVGVDWAQLLNDLLAWDRPERYIQMRWARAYYRSAEKAGAEKAPN